MFKKLLIQLSLSLGLFGVLELGFWLNGHFVIGINPFWGIILCLAIFLVGVPLLLKGYGWLNKFLKRNLLINPASFCIIGLFVFLYSGLYMQILMRNSTMEITIHDNYYVVSNMISETIAALIFLIFAFVYYFYPRIFGRYLNNHLGFIHFWITFGIMAVFLLPNRNEGFVKTPRRYIEIQNNSSFQQFWDISKPIYTKILEAIILAQLIFLFNLVYSKFKGIKILH